MNIYFQHRIELAPNIWEYVFTPEGYVDFVPGQYVDVQLSDVVNDPRGSKRTFTLTSLPGDPHMTFVTKFTEPNSPYKRQLDTLARGTFASIGDAMGDLVLPKSTAIPLVFIAGGIGIASYISMINSLIKKNEQRDILMYYAVRHTSERIFQTTLKKYSYLAPIRHILSPERIKAETVIDDLKPSSLIYLSGSERFVEELRYSLQAKGILNENIVYDFFDGYIEL